jgi:hypothetical protein
MPEYCFIQGCPNHYRGKKTLGATTNVTDPKKSRLFYVPKDYILTSDPPLKETVLGVFDLAKIVAGGSKNKQIDGFCAKFFAKSIAKNRNRLAFVIWEKKKN